MSLGSHCRCRPGKLTSDREQSLCTSFLAEREPVRHVASAGLSTTDVSERAPFSNRFLDSFPALTQFCCMQTWYALNQVGVAQSPARSELATPGARRGASAILIWKQLRAHRGADAGSCACVSGITAAKSGRRSAAVGNMVGRSCGKTRMSFRWSATLPWDAHEDK